MVKTPHAGLVKCCDAPGSRVTIDVDQRGNDTRYDAWSKVAAPQRDLFQNHSGEQGNSLFGNRGKDSNHVTSNHLLGHCIHFRRHRVHCHDFN